MEVLPGDEMIAQKIFSINTADYNIIFSLWPMHTIYRPFYCNLIATAEHVCVSLIKIMVSHQEMLGTAWSWYCSTLAGHMFGKVA